MKSLCISLLLSTCVYYSVRACSCAYIPSFCETITYSNNGVIHSNYLIVHASVEDKFASGMRIKVIDVLFGQPDQNELIIANGNGADCRMSTSQFTIGDQHIFALSGESPDGFNLSECGVTLLKVEGHEVTGAIAPNITRLAVEDFPQLGGCGNIGEVLSTITVTPTLTSDIITIETRVENIPIQFTMYDMMGRVVLSPDIHSFFGTHPIIIQANHFPAGSYILVIESTGIRKTIRIVVVS